MSWREPTGRQRSKFFKLMREAKAFKASLETDIVQRNYVDPSAGDRVRFRVHAARWLAGRTVERATAARDESLMRVHVLPRWGDNARLCRREQGSWGCAGCRIRV